MAPADGNLPMINRPAALSARCHSGKIIARPPYYCQIDSSMKMLFTSRQLITSRVSATDRTIILIAHHRLGRPRGNIASRSIAAASTRWRWRLKKKEEKKNKRGKKNRKRKMCAGTSSARTRWIYGLHCSGIRVVVSYRQVRPTSVVW